MELDIADNPALLSLMMDEPITNRSNILTVKKSRSLSSLRTRWLILFLVCIVLTGSYYSYDIPAALHQELDDYMSPDTNYEVHFNLLYSVYSIPNIILPLFGGNIADRFGTSICVLIFASVVFIGQLIVAIGVGEKRWGVMILGRAVFGLGGENLVVVISAMLSKWFEGKEMAFAMGISLAISRLGSVFNNLVSPAVANGSNASTVLAFYIGVILNALAVVAGGFTYYIDVRAARKLEQETESLSRLTASLLEDRCDDVDYTDHLERPESIHVRNERLESKEDDVKVRLSDMRRFSLLFWLLCVSCIVVYGCVLPFNNVASGILLERNYFMKPPADCTLLHPNECTAGTLAPQGGNPSTDLNGNACPSNNDYAPVLPSSLNVTTKLDGSWEHSQYVYNPVTSEIVDCGDPFWSNACTKNFCDEQDEATEVAARAMSIPFTIAAFLSPPLGHLVDRFGCRALVALIVPIVFLIVHLVLAFANNSPVAPLVFQGIAYSMYAAALWPSVPLTIEAKYTATAFGVITSIQNLGLAIFPLIVAAIFNVSWSYIPNVEVFFVSCASVGIASGVFLNLQDRKTGGVLNAVHVDGDMQGSSDQIQNREHEDYISNLAPSSEISYIS
eukprot:CAMPEP_0195521622 /NCGR_PEP_ID=MMETSP0794_2-20130614/19064_1 /TAXON_ID=515487 /ORGANISM="Stephanopyxis turris, Strain CCMP 815" /LENGTH=617 /DNA_ID=CAMNT_0040651221 /DNA_START=15 /DNA_END=1868 /DNA_ORIENTATION=+